ncbi:MmcQ/YjbR family DNA-binding protein [Edaphobacter paludis]|uniref:MmcQ/YjbR family DNA-binding protein n=2 Tax=Edaphobacter paludis TaxID=3035702 RepID=A0AAU7CZ72_9BACT
MDAERIRAFLLKLPHVVETMQWGANLVFWTGDKAIGGKMFALVNLDGDGRAVISYSAGAERYAELLEIDGIFPAPYMARIYWVAAERWSVFRNPEWEQQLRSAYDLTLAKLPPKTRATLALPKAKQKQLIAERRKLLAARSTTSPN